jgi:hypothetical protein
MFESKVSTPPMVENNVFHFMGQLFITLRENMEHGYWAKSSTILKLWITSALGLGVNK